MIELLLGLGYFGYILLLIFVVMPLGLTIGGVVFIIMTFVMAADNGGCAAIVYLPLGIAMLIFGIWWDWAVIHDLILFFG